MKRTAGLVLLVFILIFSFVACEKWKDPAATTDPRLTNPYCNDPLAVNYNWGFPGKPDNSICFYASDLFRGQYIFNDSVFLADNTFVSFKVDTFWIYGITTSKIGIVGLCPSKTDTLKLTAQQTYTATVDSNSLYFPGQSLCRVQDTVNGTITKDQVDSTILHVSFTVMSDTGINVHYGNAIKR